MFWLYMIQAIVFSTRSRNIILFRFWNLLCLVLLFLLLLLMAPFHFVKDDGCKPFILPFHPRIYNFFITCQLLLLDVLQYLTTLSHSVGSEVLTALVIKSSVLGNIMQCSLVKVSWHLGGTYHAILRDEEWAKQEISMKQAITRTYQLAFTGLQSIISQKREALLSCFVTSYRSASF
jgi:hypothetical protein